MTFGKVFKAHGTHVLADLHGADAMLLADALFLERVASEAAHCAGATLLTVSCHHFGPGQGVAGVVLLAESHLTFHTWPEHGFAAIDAFMCGECKPELAIKHMSDALRAESHLVRTVARGARQLEAVSLAQDASRPLAASVPQ